MNADFSREWPHCTADIFDLRGPEHVEVFDDWMPGYVALYIADDHGNRYPARTVTTAKIEHFNAVLSAWAESRPVVDRREKQIPPLPDTAR